ncbi:MAG: hypothetical protein AB1746_09840 [Candidatus Zixiibacteriota bacterium]
MNTRIYPIKIIPPYLSFSGDHKATQAALMLAAVAKGKTIIKNAGTGVDTNRTISFLKKLGVGFDRNDDGITVEAAGALNIPEEDALEYKGGIFALSLILGMLTGLNRSCCLKYSEYINHDIIDSMIDVLNDNGIDIFHEADTRTIVIRAATEFPIEIRITSSLSYLKNCLLMFGLVSGRSVLIREILVTNDIFQNYIARFGGNINMERPKPIITPDPKDPRKKVRTTGVDYRHEIKISTSTSLRGTDIDLPPDSDMITALMSLAILNKKNITLDNIPLDRVRMKFINYLKVCGVEPVITDRKVIDNISYGTVTVKGAELKVRKTAGEQASALIEDIPFMAVMASLGSGTSIIRGVREFSEWGIDPFVEIAQNLEKINAKCGILEDGLVIEGVNEIAGADFGPFQNPKVALAFMVLSLSGQGWSTLDNFELISDHYPDFIRLMRDYSKEPVISQD